MFVIIVAGVAYQYLCAPTPKMSQLTITMVSSHKESPLTPLEKQKLVKAIAAQSNSNRCFTK